MWATYPVLHHAGRESRRSVHHDHRGDRRDGERQENSAGVAQRRSRAVRLLPVRPDHVGGSRRLPIEALGHCADCHTPRYVLMASAFRRKLGGAVVDGWKACNISSDAEWGIGAWSDAQLV